MAGAQMNSPPVGVATSSPLLGIGLAEALAGWDLAVYRVTDTDRWWACHPDGVLVMEASRSADFDRIADLTTQRPMRILALIERASTSTILAAINAGAIGIISLDWPTDAVRLAVAAVAVGLTLMSTESFQSLANNPIGSADERDRSRMVTDEELSYLRALSHGDKVWEIAETIGYSEREVYRRLSRLYRRMGVSGRTEAVLRASRMGLLDVQTI